MNKLCAKGYRMNKKNLPLNSRGNTLKPLIKGGVEYKKGIKNIYYNIL